MSRGPGKCLCSEPEPVSRFINYPVLQIKELGPKAQNHLSWMWGRKKGLEIWLPKTAALELQLSFQSCLAEIQAMITVAYSFLYVNIFSKRIEVLT